MPPIRSVHEKTASLKDPDDREKPIRTAGRFEVKVRPTGAEAAGSRN
jgi:hypothetical protein